MWGVSRPAHRRGTACSSLPGLPCCSHMSRSPRGRGRCEATRVGMAHVRVSADGRDRDAVGACHARCLQARASLTQLVEARLADALPGAGRPLGIRWAMCGRRSSPAPDCRRCLGQRPVAIARQADCGHKGAATQWQREGLVGPREQWCHRETRQPSAPQGCMMAQCHQGRGCPPAGQHAHEPLLLSLLLT